MAKAQKHYCEYYIPNNSDYFRPGGCMKIEQQCPYAGDYPEFSVGDNADKQKQCVNYQEWIDPLKIAN